MSNYLEHLLTALNAAQAAGQAILEVYQKPDFKTELKEDASPVTEADHAAHSVIMDILEPTGFPILSEEGKDVGYEERRKWKLFWLVDPLDGTKEFIRRNGEFTVNIALISERKTILGILYAPLLDVMYFSESGIGAYRMENFTQKWTKTDSIDKLLLHSESLPLESPGTGYKVVASRSHINKLTRQYIKSVQMKHPDLEMVSRGSALKFCLVAEGTAKLYPRFGPTWEWDTGAGQAIVEASGCRVTLLDEESPLDYNKQVLLNPGFIVKRD